MLTKIMCSHLCHAAWPVALAATVCQSELLDRRANTSGEYVDAGNGRIYRYLGSGGLTYAQAKAACQALTYDGFTGTGYPVVWNT